MKEFAEMLSECHNHGVPWDVHAPEDLSEIPQHADVKKLADSGPRQAAKPEYADLRRQFHDIYSHMEKEPSIIKFTMCTGDHPCATCARIINERRQTDVTWHPRRVLSLLAWNDYRFPHPQLRDPSVLPEQTGVTDETSTTEANPAAAVNRPAVTELEGRLASAQAAVDTAVQAEDFLGAANLKKRRDILKQELAAMHRSVAAQNTPPKVYALPTKPTDPWAIPGTSPYMTWEEQSQRGIRETSFHIPQPLRKKDKALEQMIVCRYRKGGCGCRYIGKTPTEMQRHEILAHKAIKSETPITDKAGRGTVFMDGYTTVGLEPQVKPQNKKKSKKTAKASTSSAGAEAEHVSEVVEEDVLADEGDEGDESDEVGASELVPTPPVKKFRSMPLQKTEDRPPSVCIYLKTPPDPRRAQKSPFRTPPGPSTSAKRSRGV